MRTTAVIVLAATLLAQNNPGTAKREANLNGTVLVHCSDDIGAIAGFGNSQLKVQTQFTWTLGQPYEFLDELTLSLSQTQPLSRAASCGISVTDIDGFLAAVELVEEAIGRNYDERFDTAAIIYKAKQGLSLTVAATPPNAMRVTDEKRLAKVSYSGVSVYLSVAAIGTLKNLVIRAHESIKVRQSEVEQMREE